MDTRDVSPWDLRPEQGRAPCAGAMRGGWRCDLRDGHIGDPTAGDYADFHVELDHMTLWTDADVGSFYDRYPDSGR